MNYRAVEHPVFSARAAAPCPERKGREARSRPFCDARLSRTSLMLRACLRAGVPRELLRN